MSKQAYNTAKLSPTSSLSPGRQSLSTVIYQKQIIYYDAE